MGKRAILTVIFQTGLTARPVNLMVLFDQTINLVHRSLTILGTSMVLLTHRSLYYFFGDFFCQAFNFVPVFGTIYYLFGNFGITCFRVICLKQAVRNMSIKNHWPLSILIVLMSLAASFLVALIFNFNKTKSALRDMCYGYPEGYIEVLKTYEDAGNDQIKKVQGVI